MAKYALLTRWTQEGMTKVKDSPKRLEETKKRFKEYGADLKEFYGAIGQYNMLVIYEAPDIATAWRAGLALSEQGFVRSEMIPLFTEVEYRDVIAGLK